MPRDFRLSPRAKQAFIENIADLTVDVAERVLSRNSYPPASLPYQVPHKRTGLLSRAWTTRVDGDEATITAQAPYAAYLEDGTKRMSPRPFAEAIVDEVLLDINVNTMFRNPVTVNKRV